MLPLWPPLQSRRVPRVVPTPAQAQGRPSFQHLLLRPAAEQRARRELREVAPGLREAEWVADPRALEFLTARQSRA